MWILVITILIVLAIFLAFCRIIGAILKPIFIYLYQKIINSLRGMGMTEQAAKAIVSGVVIFLILLILLSSC